ncbi:FACT complex subunit [Tilletia horrida]|uniref:FACT complex subunit POB3 n=1 Tax=Tilletia horrida TaxID=155126 RepID=A0AAN6G6F8_9BASI|nr:FACT complex subunit [Tilletia horrida]KAK0524059.1 FACT complex subunit [Tilletia horrida]KAK0526647.1 FACT complex subunit [Tilletia horrida]KAK0559208.1 FACT complex subunit [Tilletia horrida]
MAAHAQFDGLFLGLSAQTGRMRLAAGGLGYKASGEGSKAITVPADNLDEFHWVKVARNFQLRIRLFHSTEGSNGRRLTLDGFVREQHDELAAAIKTYYDKPLLSKELSVRGWNWGEAQVVDDDVEEVQFLVKDKVAFEIPISHIANSNIARQEVSIEFLNPEQQEPVQNTGATGSSSGDGGRRAQSKHDQLVEIKLYIPGEIEREGSDDGQAEPETAANSFHEAIKARADMGPVQGDAVIVFRECLILTPRGRYDIDMFPNFLRLRGKTYDYKILYSSITRLFLLPKPDEVHVHFVIGLDPPIRQGQTRYPYLVLQFPREEEMDAELNLTEEELQDKYQGKLKKRYEEPTFRIVSNVFKHLSNQKLTVPGSFESSAGHASIKCNVKAVEGLLYPLDKALLWVSKQPIYLPYSQIHQVVFSRVGGSVSSSRTFDLRVSPRDGTETTFLSLNREEHDRMNSFFLERKVRIKNEMNDGLDINAAGAAAALLSDDDEDMADASRSRANAMDEDEDSEDDEDFQESSGDSSSDDGGSDDDDFSEAGGDDAPPKKKKKKSN